MHKICSGQTCTCQAADDVLKLNLITNALAGESMSWAKSFHSWPGPWGFALHSSSPAHMGVIAQKLSNWNQWKGKAWNLGKAENSCSELQNRLSTFADWSTLPYRAVFAKEARRRKAGPIRSVVWENFSLGQNVYLQFESFFVPNYSMCNCTDLARDLLLCCSEFIFIEIVHCSYR